MDLTKSKRFLTKKISKKDLQKALRDIFESSFFKKKGFLFIIIFFSVLHFAVRNYENFFLWDTDSPSYYTAAEGILRGINIYDHQAFQNLADELFGRSQTVYPYLYWPIPAQVFTPFTLLDYNSYFDALFVINIILTVICFVLIYKLLELKKSRTYITLMFLFIAFSWNIPLVITYHHGQVNLFVFAFILAALWLLKKNRLLFSSFFLCLAVYFKIYPALFFVLFLLQKRVRYLIYSAVSGAVIFLASVLFFSFKPWESFIRMGLNNFLYGKKSEFFFDFNAQWGNVSLNGFLSQLFMYLGLPRNLVFPFLLVLLVLSILIFRKAFQRIIQTEDLNVSASAVLISTLILSTISWNHHYIIMIYPLAVLIHHISEEKRYGYLLPVILLTVPILNHPWAGGFPFYQVLMFSSLTILVLMMIFHRDRSPAQQKETI